MIVCKTPETIRAFRLLSLKAALGLELKGLRRSRSPSAFAIVKQEFGFKGGKQKVYDQFIAALKTDGILV